MALPAYEQKIKPLKHGGREYPEGAKLERFWNPPFPSFLCVSKILIFCYCAGFPTFCGGLPHEVFQLSLSARVMHWHFVPQSSRANSTRISICLSDACG